MKTNLHNGRLLASIAGPWAVGLLAIGLPSWLGVLPARGQGSTTVNWVGGNLLKRWDDPANWNPAVVPWNGGTSLYTVIVPANSSISYLSGGANQIDALSFGDGSTLDIAEGHSLEVTGVGVLRGLIQADGTGSAFRANGVGVVLEQHPRLRATAGATISLGSSLYNWAGSDANADLVVAQGAGSLVDLGEVSSFAVAGGNGQRTFTVRAAEDGVVDLSRLGVLSGPGGDDWLNLNVNTRGDLRLDALVQAASQVRFDIRNSSYQLPALQRASSTEFLLSSNVTLALPSLLSLQSGKVRLDPGSRLESPTLAKVTDSSVTVADASVMDTPGLATLENVPLSLAGSGALIATNLTAYRASDIAVQPGKDLRTGLLTDVNSSRLSVVGGLTFRIGATSYSYAEDWRWQPAPIFSADGAGSLLDARTVKSITTHGAYSGAWTYDVVAKNGGIVDLSGLEVATGPRWDAYEDNDWLVFRVETDGRILLPNLREIFRKTKFRVQTKHLELPSLQTCQFTSFHLTDGARLDLPNLVFADVLDVAWGFNASFSAPKLTRIFNTDLQLSPQRIWVAPPLTNCDASRLAVSGGAKLAIAATNYVYPEDWRWQPAPIFSANGAESLLDARTVQSITTYGAYSGAWTYDVVAENSGVVDLSGLEVATGPRWDAYENNDWLVFTIRTGGSILLPSLRETPRRTKFNIQVPHFELPVLERCGATAFNLADEARVNLPSLTYANDLRVGWGFNSKFNAPKLATIWNTYLSLSPGREWDVPPLKSCDASRFAVSGGVSLELAATNYFYPEDWRDQPEPIFLADGARSSLDARQVESITTYGAYSGAWEYDVTAKNGGVIDLSGLKTAIGPRTDAYDNNDRLRFLASTGGRVRCGGLRTSRRVLVSVSDPGSMIEAESLTLGAPTQLTVSSGGLLRVLGDVTYDNTDANTVVMEGGTLQMSGALPQRLEVAGKDLGATGSATRNFGVSGLTIGETNQTCVVRLVDIVNNGNRGAAGDPECLYLYGLDGAGLRLLHGSRLILNGLNVYALMGGQMRSLTSLIPAGTNSAPFGDGFIALTGGPKIVQMVPATAVLPPVGSLTISFDIPITETSFTPEDVTLTGPEGLIPVTGISRLEGNTFRLLFAPQATSGTYTVRVGPEIDELAGHLSGMDQDGDGLSGESGADVFTGTFRVDGDAPAILAAVSVQNGNRVGVRFDEPVDPAIAGEVAMYSVNGAAPQSAEVREGNREVVLTVPAQVGESFALTVTDLADPLGNRATRQHTGILLPLEHRDLGSPGSDPRERGSVVTWGDDRFENTAGGSAIWDGTDRGQWLFERRVGDFDVRVQLGSLKKTGSWTQAGLMARVSADANSRHVYVHAQYGTGYDRHAAGYRATTGGNTAYWPDQPTSVKVPIPNAWLRLKREGDVFTALRSTNGIEWIEYARLTQSLPASLFVGMATSANNNNAGQATTAVYAKYGDLGPGIVSPPQNQSVASGARAVFGVSARGAAPLAYQWFHDGQAIDGATLPTLELTDVQLDDVGDYRVQLGNAWGTNLTAIATLTVDGVGVNGGLEADVSPSPRGDGTVTIQDWVRTGLFVAALEDPANSSQFQRADCAPAPCGDGRLSVADWTQAGLYAAALVEPVPTACGQTSAGASPALAMRMRSSRAADAAPRRLALEPGEPMEGPSVEVRVRMATIGDENAAGFSIEFDPTQLRFESVVAGPGLGGGFLQVNPRQAHGGRVGLAVAQGVGETFPAGSLELARLRFVRVGHWERAGIEFGNRPIDREVVDARAEVLAATYQGTVVAGRVGPRLQGVAAVENGGLEFTFTAESGSTWIVEDSTDLIHWSEYTRRVAIEANLRFTDERPVTEGRRFYRLRRVE